jgi:hypothetical protein
MLEAEPNNPYDEAAIKVFVEPTEVPLPQRGRLEAELQGTSIDLEEFFSFDRIDIGYIGASYGKPLARAQATLDQNNLLSGNAEWQEHLDALGHLKPGLECRLGFLGEGLIVVRLFNAAQPGREGRQP